MFWFRGSIGGTDETLWVMMELFEVFQVYDRMDLEVSWKI
jgi:hypothetical protein